MSWRPKPETEVHVGERLKRIAYGRGWNAQRLAAEMGTTSSTLSKAFTGLNPISFRFLMRFCNTVDCQDLFPSLCEQARKQEGSMIGRRGMRR